MTREPLLIASPLKRAVEAAGSQIALARALGCTQQFVSICVKRDYVTLEMAIAIEGLYGIARSTLIDPKLRAALQDFSVPPGEKALSA